MQRTHSLLLSLSLSRSHIYIFSGRRLVRRRAAAAERQTAAQLRIINLMQTYKNICFACEILPQGSPPKLCFAVSCAFALLNFHASSEHGGLLKLRRGRRQCFEVQVLKRL